MKKLMFLIFCLGFLVISAMPGNAAEENAKNAAMQSLKARFPGVRIYSENGNISRVFGRNIGEGSSPITTAESFKAEYAGLFEISPEDLRLGSNLVGGIESQPLMYNRDTGEYKFTLVYYSQYRGNIPVFRADLGLLVRNVDGYPLSMVASALRDIGDFQVPVGSAVNPGLASAGMKSFSSELNIISEPGLVVWAGVDDMIVSPKLAVELIADNGKPGTPEYQKWLLLIDNQSGEILYSENMIVETDVTGNVSGMATQGFGADICGPEEPTPLPYTRAEIQGGNWVYADQSGDFTIPNAGDTEVTVISDIRGQWFRVYNQSGSNAHLTQNVVPPGPAQFMHNEANSQEFNRAEVNGYISANVVRDYVLTYNPEYPTIFQQEEFPVNVNLGQTCNAYYDYSSINFFRSGGGCSNTAFSTVVYHEYGHHLVAVGGSGQGQYGEGFGDVMGVLISEDPGLAYGFQNNCSQYLRTADNNYQYPCNGEIHDCGQLISACIWDTMNELMASYPDDYRDIIGNLAVNSIPLHRGEMITPSITIDILTLDDDNGNIDDGTPHYDEICAGFGAHNMDCPEIILLTFEYPDGLPEMVSPYGGTSVNVEVFGSTQEPQSGTGMLHYNLGTGWQETAMDEGDPNSYNVVFPEVECGSVVEFYFSAQTTSGETVNDPAGAPAEVYTALGATGFVSVFDDDFETDQGWVVSGNATDGQWERGIPITECDRGNPIEDYDGSGYCYLTDNSADNLCNSDVDGGYTYLISPAFDLTDMPTIIRYALWYTNGYGDNPFTDLFKVYISSNNGQNWILVETFGPVSEPGWTYHSFMTNDYISPTNQVRVRFEASDLDLGSIVEAGIDAFSIESWECDPTEIVENGDNNLPSNFALLDGYPNPFNAKVTIQYALPVPSDVTIEIFDLLGRRIQTLVSGTKTAGYHQVVWDAADNSSGTYFYRMKTGEFSDTRKILLLK